MSKPIHVFIVFKRGEAWIAQLQEMGLNGSPPGLANAGYWVEVTPTEKEFGEITDPIAKKRIYEMLVEALNLTPRQLDEASRIVAEQDPQPVPQ